VDALIAKSAHRTRIEAARSRAELLTGMAGSVQAATLKKAEESGSVESVRHQLGLDELIPGRLGQSDGFKAQILEVPASPADEARWGKQGRR
jgi:hypothetical protein